ncbi:MAG: hypothetical protein A2836_02785 [Candidatus Taylorbacteria bacterium RIFCSPHIGHO2_01_FULL_45_63]|uniref:Uncharacterized protein n=1 Tax=Candidatus Taylorbacteria bacterium RIFCSPHIGHO2_02_FULL_45_35 TaxID=1802311 RepID=A0A1G2MPA0_9BACT|nr:MAG: hypothetical protein A2836_02785 [Candidatus Taylorbacteria bacterium RIFCSPHIGHO2_01_FULL_45_63]OHA25708.1 MAG: hypothetical protein A3D56_00860 [Candidatus Taylorbacteria bacterium RIFCSPHIGHO2_02_FULL_45_35]OHA33984.1 MAG: hypothetical protein A3A22_04215 [Candidatus Taylorbacteria bacterium RIFCSPLOWO2_01_FULL_45_34b]QBM02331.1 hypothetical protein [uncultured archaeon]
MKPVVLVHGFLTAKRLENIWREIKRYRDLDQIAGSPDTEIGLVIASEGGRAKKTIELIEKIKRDNIYLTAKIYQAESAAALLALAATEREIVQHGVFSIHLGAVTIESCDLAGRGKIPRARLSELKTVRQTAFDLLKLSGFPERGPFMDSLIARNRLALNPEECLELGLVQRII